MSKFYVGQRVRIVRVDSGSIARTCLGKEGVVNELFCTSSTGKDGRIGVTVAGCIPPYAGYDANDWCFEPCQLEPLNPPKSQIDGILAMKDLPDFEITRVAAKSIRNLILDLRIRWHESNALWYDKHECTRLKNLEWLKVQRLKGMRTNGR